MSTQPTIPPGGLERLRVGLALCLAVERDDTEGAGILQGCLPPGELVHGLVAAFRSLAHSVCCLSGEEPAQLLGRLIDNVLARELAQWW